jgi:hypothetical protein
MSRKIRYPNNPLVRLRAELSANGQKMTRRMFAERYGFSVDSLKAIETGKYKINNIAHELCKKIGIEVNSLTSNARVFKSWDGSTFSIMTLPPPMGYCAYCGHIATEGEQS